MQQYGKAAGLTAVLAGPFGSAGTGAKLTQVNLQNQISQRLQWLRNLRICSEPTVCQWRM